VPQFFENKKTVARFFSMPQLSIPVNGTSLFENNKKDIKNLKMQKTK